MQKFFLNNKTKQLFKSISTSPLFYNFLIDITPNLNIKCPFIKETKTINFLKIYMLWKYIEKKTGKSDIGLTIADYFTLEKSGILGELFINSKNLKDAISLMDRFLGIIVGGVSMRYAETDEESIFFFDIAPRSLIPFSATECLIKICYNWVKIYTKDIKFDIKEIHFCYPIPKHISYYKENFPNTKLYFSDQSNYIVLDKNLFYIHNSTFSNNIYQYVIQHANRIINNVKQDSNFELEIKNKILIHIAHGNCNIKTISQELNISESTLKRNLKKYDTSFKKLLEEVRISLSESMIKDKTLTFEDIAYLLGYSEYSPFFRAFKRWFNLTPSEFRQTFIS